MLTITEVNTWSYTTIQPYVFMAWKLIHNFAFYLTSVFLSECRNVALEQTATVTSKSLTTRHDRRNVSFDAVQHLELKQCCKIIC
jgi:hypothetical protein